MKANTKNFISHKRDRLINISFDDVIPSFNGWNFVDDIIAVYPRIKMDFFVSINSLVNSSNNDICHEDNQDFVKRLKDYGHHIEIGYHGCLHTLGENEPEFSRKTYEEAVVKFSEFEGVMRYLELPFVKAFRPPQWKINQEVIRALEDCKWSFLSDSPFYHKEYSTKLPRVYSNVDIYDGWQGMYNQEEVVGVLPSIHKVFFLRGHFVSKHTNNLNAHTFRKLCEMICPDGTNFDNEYRNKYIFLSEYVERYLKKGKTR